MHRSLRILLAAVLVCTAAASARGGVIPSPSNDLLLSSNGGVADINGSTTDGSANYNGLPPANLNDGERDGVYNNGLGVDGVGSIAHSSGGGPWQEMGVTTPNPYDFTSVILFNRTDCCGFRIDGGGTVPFTLNIYDNRKLLYTHNYTFNPDISLTGYNPNTGFTESASGMTMTLPGSGVVGNYVQIFQNNNDYMNLAELEAYGAASSVPEPASLSLLGLGGLGLALARRRRLA